MDFREWMTIAFTCKRCGHYRPHHNENGCPEPDCKCDRCSAPDCPGIGGVSCRIKCDFLDL